MCRHLIRNASRYQKADCLLFGGRAFKLGRPRRTGGTNRTYGTYGTFGTYGMGHIGLMRPMASASQQAHSRRTFCSLAPADVHCPGVPPHIQSGNSDPQGGVVTMRLVVHRGSGLQWPEKLGSLQYACAVCESLERLWRISRLLPISIHLNPPLGGRRARPRAELCWPSISHRLALCPICPGTFCPNRTDRPCRQSTLAAAARRAIQGSGSTAMSCSAPVLIAALR